MSYDSCPWIEIDLDAIACNIRLLRGKLQPGVRLLAAVKSNAYGHGAAEVSSVVLRQGADMLGVARLEEGIVLRESGIEAPILVFGPVPPVCAGDLLQYRLTPTIVSAEDARSLGEALPIGRQLRVHVKIDTGMGRLGCYAQDEGCASDFASRAATVARDVVTIAEIPNLHVDGVFTHLACADVPDNDWTVRQLQAFKGVLAEISRFGIRPPLCHAANSAAIFRYPESHLDMVRAGIALYGYGSISSLGLRPAMTLKTRIVQLRQVPTGTTVGYGMTYRTVSPTTIAVVALGYGDGYSRAHSNCGNMLVRGQMAPIIGRVCMDLTMLDVGHIPGAQVGDEVVAFGLQGATELPADEVAARIGTISYEIITALTVRVRRIYKGTGSDPSARETTIQEIAA